MNPRVLRTLRGLAAAGLAAGLSLAAAPTQAADPVPGPDGTTAPKLAAGSTTVYGSATGTSTKKKKLRISLNAGTYSGSGSLGVHLALGDESHNWSFTMPGKDLKLSSAGKGTLKTKAAGPYGTIALTITPQKKWTTRKCQGRVVSKSRPVVLKGAFRFDSGGAWGAVGSKRGFTLKGTVSKVTGDGSGCVDDVCPTASGSWYYFGGDAFLSGSWKPGAQKGVVTASRTVQLPKPKGATRFDLRSVKVAAPVLETGEGDGATLRVRGGAAVTGTATLTSDFKAPTSSTCRGTTWTTTNWFSDFANGDTPLTVRMSAFGNISLPDGDGAHFSRTLED